MQVSIWIVLVYCISHCQSLPMKEFITTNSIVRGAFLEEGSLPLPILDMIRLAEKEGEIYIYDPTSHSSTAVPIRSIGQERGES